MKNLTVNFNENSVNFKFMANNRDVVTNSNLRQDIAKYGIAQDLIVLPLSEFDGELSSQQFTFGKGESAGTFVVLDGQHRLTCLNEIIAQIAKVEAKNEKIKDEKKKLAVPQLASFEIPLKVVDRSFLERFGGLDNYVIMLNNTSKKWNSKDFIANAYKRNEQSFELRIINKLAEEKMSISTISRWMSGNTKVINAKSLQRLAKGEKIHGLDCIRGMKLYLYLSKLGFTSTFLNKRYMIDAINDLRRGDCEEKVLLKLSKIRAINSIETISSAQGDVVSEIKHLINSNYDEWREAHNITVEAEKREIAECSLLSSVNTYDIEDFLCPLNNAA